MKAHFKYLSYVIRHKWYVFLAGLKFRAPLWRLIIHDWTKFLPREWFPYVKYFYGVAEPKDDIKFNAAWNHHQKCNPHHWQYWILISDSGEIGDEGKLTALQMPQHFICEMLADWVGAGRAILGDKSNALEWYLSNEKNILLHPVTKYMVLRLLESYYDEPPSFRI